MEGSDPTAKLYATGIQRLMQTWESVRIMKKGSEPSVKLYAAGIQRPFESGKV
jgi:hypothetical protein